MTGDTAVETPVVVDNKVEDVLMSDKEVIAEEEKELEKAEEKTDEPEKTEETKEEVKEEAKKINILQKLFGKKKDTVSPKIDEATKTDKDIIGDEEKEGEKKEGEEEKKEEETPEKVQHRFKKLFSMKKAKKEETEKKEGEEEEEKKEGEGEEKKDEEKKEGEDEIAEASEVDTTTASQTEKKTLMQKLMTIKRDLMANKKEEAKVEEKTEDKAEEKTEEGEKKEGEEEEKKDGDEEKKEGEEEKKDDENKDELGNEKPKATNRVKKFFSMKRERKTTETKKEGEEEKKEGEEEAAAGPSDEKKDEEETDGEKIEKAEKVNLLQRLFGRKAKPEVEEKKEEGEEKKEEEGEKPAETTEETVDAVAVAVAEPVDATMRLHLVNRTLAVPSISPMQLKLESWLKFHGVKYENTQDKDNLPAKAYLPMQSNEYLTELAAKYEKEMPMELDAEQKNVQHAMTSLVEKNIHFAILFWQCSNIDNIVKGYKINLQTYLNSKIPLALLRLFFKNNFCKNGLKMVKSNTGNTTEDLETLAKNDLKVLGEMLGDKDFFFGSSASLLDLVVFSHLTQVTVVAEEVACSLRDTLKADHQNLLDLVDRMRSLIWGEHWAEATDKLELNPHLPKPILEEAKAIVEEVVEAATEEKKEEATEEEKKEEATEEKKDEPEAEEKAE